MMNNYYFTFGDDRLDKYVKITAEDEKQARIKMCLECGRRWCTSYDEENFMEVLRKRPEMKLLYHFVVEKEELLWRKSNGI